MATFAEHLAQLNASRVPYATRHPLWIGTTGMGPPDGATAVATYAQDMTTLGNTMDRTYISLNVCNPSAGVYDWTNRQGAPDLWYNTSVAAGRKLILQPIFAPEFWMSGVGVSWTHSDRPYADIPPYPSADATYYLAQLATACTAMATHYPSSLVIWEPGNEWNNAGIYHRPGGLVVAMPPAEYAAYFAAQYNAIKAVNPYQKVIIGGMFRIDSAPAFSGNGNISGIAALAPLKTALDALGITPDGVAIHPYMLGATNSNPMIDRGPNATGVNSWQSVGRCLTEMDRIGWHLGVYVTETGFRASQSNAQGAFNCSSEATKSLWNRYEHDNTWLLYSKDARPAGSAWVEAMLYYRDQEYPSPTASSYSGAIGGDPPEGPHALTTWGVSKFDFTTKVTNHLPLPLLDDLAISGPSSGIVTHALATYTATGTSKGVAYGATPVWVSSDPTVVSITTSATSNVGTPTIVGPGTTTIWAGTYAANRAPIAGRILVTIAAQEPAASAISPSDGWQVAVTGGGTVQFTASVTDQGSPPNTIAGGWPGAWTSSDPTNAPIDANGLLTAVGVSTGVVVTFTPTGYAGAASTSTGNVVLNPVLQITSGAVTLLNEGETAVVVSDGTTTITGCTLVISDGIKATASGQTVRGTAETGTYTVKAQKVGYDDSSTVTFTCSGGAIFDDKDTIGLSNGANVPTYTDVDGNTWAQATAGLQPTYVTSAINGHAALAFDGVDDFLKAAATVTRLNGSEVTYAALYLPLSAAPVANEQILDNRDTTNSQGFVSGRSATSTNHIISYYTAVGVLTQHFDSGAMASSSWFRMIDRFAQGAQSRMLNGAVIGTSGVDATYRNPTTAPVRPTKAGSIFGVAGNNAQCQLAAEILVNRAVTDTERLQIDLRLKNYGAL